MARINLLPWREERREVRRKRFLLVLVAVMVGAMGAVLVADQVISGAIDRQVARNDYIGKQLPWSMSGSSRSVISRRAASNWSSACASSRTCKAIARSAGEYLISWREPCPTACISPK